MLTCGEFQKQYPVWPVKENGRREDSSVCTSLIYYITFHLAEANLRERLGLLEKPGFGFPLIPVHDENGTIPENKQAHLRACIRTCIQVLH